jgi:hypothetical protein
MSRNKFPKPYWEMTKAELREATQEFDEEFIVEKSKPLTPEMKARWQRAKAKKPCDDGPCEQTITVRLEKALLEHCAILAKKKRISRDALIARGLKALLAAEGEG